MSFCEQTVNIRTFSVKLAIHSVDYGPRVPNLTPLKGNLAPLTTDENHTHRSQKYLILPKLYSLRLTVNGC